MKLILNKSPLPRSLYVMITRLLLAFTLTGFITNCSQSPNAPKLPPPGGSPKIFSTYSADGDASLAKGWVRGFDMSGVSFNSTRTCTLITPRHVVMAKHFKRGVKSPVIFHSRNGKRCERFIVDIKDCVGDAAVGLLDQPVPPEYTSYPLPWVKSKTRNLMGEPIVVTDQQKHLFFHQVGNISNGRLMMRHDPEERHGWGKNLIVGDSGNPSFFISNNKLVLAETHHTGGAGAGPYYGDPAVQESVVKAVKELDPNYKIKIEIVGN